MVACGQPGCSGTVEDGYCDVCGMAARPTPAAAGASAGDGAVRSPRPAVWDGGIRPVWSFYLGAYGVGSQQFSDGLERSVQARFAGFGTGGGAACSVPGSGDRDHD